MKCAMLKMQFLGKRGDLSCTYGAFISLVFGMSMFNGSLPRFSVNIFMLRPVLFLFVRLFQYFISAIYSFFLSAPKSIFVELAVPHSSSV